MPPDISHSKTALIIHTEPPSQDPSVERTSVLHYLWQGGIALLMASILWRELRQMPHAEALWVLFCRQLSEGALIWLLLCLLLLPFNWFGEVMKWQLPLSRYQGFSKMQAFRAVLAGVGVSLLTPNRMGEFGGRMLFVAPQHRWKSLAINGVGNLAQLLVLLLCGGAGSLWLLDRYLHFSPEWRWALLATGSMVLFAGGWAYFSMGFVLRVLERYTPLFRLRVLGEMSAICTALTRRDLFGILLWSFIRYAIYSTQYVCLLQFFGIQATSVDAYAAIAFIFFVQAGIPLPPIAGLLARGNLAIWVWSWFGADPLISLTVSFLLWCINLVLPALAGAVFLMSVRDRGRVEWKRLLPIRRQRSGG